MADKKKRQSGNVNMDKLLKQLEASEGLNRPPSDAKPKEPEKEERISATNPNQQFDNAIEDAPFKRKRGRA